MFENDDPGSVPRGITIAFLLHAFQLIIIPIAFVFPAAFFFIFIWSVTQFAYLLPAYLKYSAKGESETAKGILIAAGIGVLLNGTCFAALTNMRVSG